MTSRLSIVAFTVLFWALLFAVGPWPAVGVAVGYSALLMLWARRHA